MRAIVGQSVSTFFSGTVVGCLASNLGLPRRDLLLEGATGTGSLWILLGLVFPLLVAGMSVIGSRLAAYGVNTRLTTPRIRWFYSGCTAIGFTLGFCLFYLWNAISDPITPGSTNPPSYSDATAAAWDTVQWFAYVTPAVVHVLAGVGGIVMILIGLRGSGDLAAGANEALRRRRQGMSPGGSRLKGTIVTAEPAGQDQGSTRVVAQVIGPDGVRQVEAIVPGTERDWLPGAKATVYLSNYAPYDPNQTLIDARRFVRAQGFFASACPPPVPAPAGARPAW